MKILILLSRQKRNIEELNEIRSLLEALMQKGAELNIFWDSAVKPDLGFGKYKHFKEINAAAIRKNKASYDHVFIDNSNFLKILSSFKFPGKVAVSGIVFPGSELTKFSKTGKPIPVYHFSNFARSYLPQRILDKSTHVRYTSVTDNIFSYSAGGNIVHFVPYNQDGLILASRLIEYFNKNPQLNLNLFSHKDHIHYLLKQSNDNIIIMDIDKISFPIQVSTYIGNTRIAKIAAFSGIPVIVAGHFGYGGIVTIDNLTGFLESDFMGRPGGYWGEDIPHVLLDFDIRTIKRLRISVRETAKKIASVLIDQPPLQHHLSFPFKERETAVRNHYLHTDIQIVQLNESEWVIKRDNSKAYFIIDRNIMSLLKPGTTDNNERGAPISKKMQLVIKKLLKEEIIFFWDPIWHD